MYKQDVFKKFDKSGGFAYRLTSEVDPSNYATSDIFVSKIGLETYVWSANPLDNRTNVFEELLDEPTPEPEPESEPSP